jgi:hypothetical protein
MKSCERPYVRCLHKGDTFFCTHRCRDNGGGKVIPATKSLLEFDVDNSYPVPGGTAILTQSGWITRPGRVVAEGGWDE